MEGSHAGSDWEAPDSSAMASPRPSSHATKDPIQAEESNRSHHLDLVHADFFLADGYAEGFTKTQVDAV